MDQIPEWLTWIVFALSGVGALIGVAKLIEIWVVRILKRRDRRESIAEANQALQINSQMETQTARIGAESAAFKHVMDRVTTLETRVDGLQDKLADEMAKSARLEEQNANLTTELQRQRDSNHDLRKIIQSKELEAIQMKGEIVTMQEQIKTLTSEIKRLSALEARTHTPMLLEQGTPDNPVHVQVHEEE